MVPDLFILERSDRGRLRLTGRDRQSFLQGMVTNDVGRLTPGAGCYAFQLDATGHVLADLRVLCREDDLLLDVEPGQAQAVAERLEKYLIMERVRIADVTAQTRQYLIGGVGAPAFLASRLDIPDAQSWQEAQNVVSAHPDFTGVLVARTQIAPVPTFDLYAEQEISLADVEAISPKTLEALRIEAGIPRFGVDMDERVLAPETGQQARAISYKKGCYIGQEIVARIDARGHTNRALAGVRLPSGTLPAADTPIVGVDGRDAGRVTSAGVGPISGQSLALGYLRNDYAAAGTTVRIGERSGQVADLPFVSLP